MMRFRVIEHGIRRLKAYGPAISYCLPQRARGDVDHRRIDERQSPGQSWNDALQRYQIDDCGGAGYHREAGEVNDAAGLAPVG